MAPYHNSVGYHNSASTNMTQNHGSSGMGTSSITAVTTEGLEIAGRYVENMLAVDAQFPSLADKLRIGMSYNDFWPM